MTLEKSSASAAFSVETPPAGGIDDVKAWAALMFERLVLASQQPRVQSIMFGRAELAGEVAKPTDGMTAWLAANVAGAGKPEGLYFRMGGAWKLVTLT